MRKVRRVFASVVSYRNSTSNHNSGQFSLSEGEVVSYRNSTSNHNNVLYNTIRSAVVSYRNSTSNHNGVGRDDAELALYLIEILHQTTTITSKPRKAFLLYLIEILHQTTTYERAAIPSLRCILSKFYIKPQLSCCRHYFRRVVSYRNSTSNHNVENGKNTLAAVVSYRNSTSNHNFAKSCILPFGVVSYRNSTSNHNLQPSILAVRLLYLIEILHQTTTRLPILLLLRSCILSKFYIKPQPFARVRESLKVVSYRNSTSNHNSGVGVNATMSLYLIEILHQTTTTMQFRCLGFQLYLIEILHQTTTPKQRRRRRSRLYLIEILHQTTTQSTIDRNSAALYLIEILHQTTTILKWEMNLDCCILSKFYIKPQRIHETTTN